MGEPFVAMVMPRGDASIRAQGAARGFYGLPTKRGTPRIPLTTQTSLAIRCFNLLLCEVLNLRKEHPITHLAMMHDDICPDDGWLDVLLDELDRTGADMVSAVVPIKNAAGLTSTAVNREGEPWYVRRLTMHEVYELPETFGLDDISWRDPGSQLVVNSALWVIRTDAPWFRASFPEDNETGRLRVAPLAFKDHARIVQLPSGKYASEDISEDWDWSRQLLGLGLKLMATRKVGLHHERPEFHNRGVWGSQTTDEAYTRMMGLRMPLERS